MIKFMHTLCVYCLHTLCGDCTFHCHLVKCSAPIWGTGCLAVQYKEMRVMARAP
jgi:hypothetical protein